MAAYNLYKPTGKMISIPALIEDSENGEALTFQRILNDRFGTYTPATVAIPEELAPEVYETVYDQQMLRVRAPRGMVPAWDGAPTLRLPVENINGKRYAYLDFYQVKEDPRSGEQVKVGKTIRARFAINDN